MSMMVKSNLYGVHVHHDDMAVLRDQHICHQPYRATMLGHTVPCKILHSLSWLKSKVNLEMHLLADNANLNLGHAMPLIKKELLPHAHMTAASCSHIGHVSMSQPLSFRHQLLQLVQLADHVLRSCGPP